MITTVLIDVDDTLLDFHLDEVTAISDTLLSFGIDPSEETVALYSSINRALWQALERGEVSREEVLVRRFERLFSALGRDIDPVCARNAYEKRLSCGSGIIEGARELLAALHPKYSVYIISNGTVSVQTPRLERSGLLPYIDGVFLSERIGAWKPSEAFFRHVLSNIPERDKAKIIVIGDSLSADVRGGKTVGLKTCHFNPSCKPVTDIIPDYTVTKLSEIPELLEGL